jgi:cation diffusion facilitator CzcD-associated flavoprotein CzcO
MTVNAQRSVDTVVIGAGPYGLSVGAHLRQEGISFRIFGRPMDSWLSHMPKGMLLKSDGFASNIYDPNGDFPLGKFCAERGIEYADSGIPVRLDTFSRYGVEFRHRMVPEVEEKFVISLDRSPDGFVIVLEDGETFQTRRVVLAVGVTHFENIPETLRDLPPQYLTHSAAHRDLEPFRGRSVVVIGGGASALDLAGLLHEAGTDVRLVCRQPELKFHSKGNNKGRSLWQQIRHPKSGLGPGWRSRFYANAPWLFHCLPETVRLAVVRRALGPAGGATIRDKVVGKVTALTGYSVTDGEIQNGRVLLRLKADDGTTREITADHVVAATGYRVSVDRLTFLSPAIRSNIETVEGTPVLSSTFESSERGLHFVGLAAANSFGPVMRFALGAGFAAQTVARALGKSRQRNSAPVAVRAVATSSK